MNSLYVKMIFYFIGVALVFYALGRESVNERIKTSCTYENQFHIKIKNVDYVCQEIPK